MGSLTGQFSDSLTGASSSDFLHSTTHLILDFVYLGIACLLTTTLSSFGFTLVGESITKRLRNAYLSAVLRQNIAYFDYTGPGEVTTRITNDMNLIQDGISQKVGLLLTGVSGFFAALIVALVRDWKMGLVMLCLPVAVILIMGGLGSRAKAYNESSNNEYAESGTLAEEVISCIRTITAYGSQERFQKKYEKSLELATALDFKAKMAMGTMMAMMFMCMFWGYSLAFWQGNRFLQQGNSSISQIITVLFASFLAGTMLGHAAPFIAAITQAGGAANRIFATIERVSPIDPFSRNGTRLDTVRGDIEFRKVRFVYPARMNHVILDDFSLRVKAGKTTAIVGPSGSGKTTLFSLIERLYDPVHGQVFLDGASIQDLDVHWLRSQIGLVSQDNFLFNTTVYDNIIRGLGTTVLELDDKKAMALVEEAAKIANAHEFVSALPNGYFTKIGERGSTLSGGQRQRIAIARAIISNPRILLLDEATAALDTKSESVVQEALYAAAKGRTTIIIAHRLSTIKRADSIVVVEHGKVTDQGSHEELLAKETTYAHFVRAQQLQNGNEATEHAGDIGIMSPEEMGNNPEMAQTSPHNLELPLQSRSTESSLWRLTKLIWSINAPEKMYLILGILCSTLAGPAYPVQAIFFGNAIVSLVDPALSTGSHTLNFWALMLFLLGIFLFAVYILQGFCFAIVGSRLGSRARTQAFSSILRQDMAFFDARENSSGALTAFLAVEASKLTGISGATLGAILNSVLTLVSAIVVACPFGWKLTLVSMSLVPLILAGGFFRFWFVSQIERHIKRDTDAAASACEAVSGIRTVAALAIEELILKDYEQKLSRDRWKSIQFEFASSLGHALIQSLHLFISAFLFWYGGTRLIGSGDYNVQQFFICFTAVIWGAQAAGSIFSYAPDIVGAQEAAARLHSLITHEPDIDISSADGEPASSVLGHLEVDHVDFSFAARPERQVLQDINLAAHPGTFVALVGASGSGKSTVLNLIERFYDVTGGSIVVDQKNIRRYQLRELRRQIALVEQDSALCGSSIREAILGDTEDVSDEDIMHACREASIHDFVVSLSDGLNTSIGARGNRVSGGQKQRLAIAKALLRKPKILLLDEATSALDAESEKLVQRALDAAAKGRTTIAVAHRLSSIAHARRIYVFANGQVVESGSHEDLLKRRGKYWELVQLQSLGK
ncbi:hypothetical protein ASPZODRAFT_95516 [Penicilliopsis zonata CBS 506.65]|uniref:ABC transporter n=1 Tax=Penicilliopsis zonata CBS 506.65 TaxID=1073090 RepID=A0A1L9SIP7_9EURO|nr:hypothetical protein ASPZODRAFT_95516 [Penicilliopsis zonata CBS 506.65]OJJ46971.1 hypothetical protein ASPZODRAFT_95516 [Penicilliopsis zonata CBS 506.65]